MDFRDRIVRLDRVPASQIENAPWNMRRHPESQISALKGSFEELGFFKPLDVYVTDEGMYRLIDGEARRNLIEADVSPDQLVPISITDLSESEAKKALLIADPLSALATQDSAALESLMRDVQIADEALAAMVAGMAEEAGIIPPEETTVPVDPEPQTDRAEELQRQWQTAPGQLWEIVGKSGMVHRLLIGDCRNPEDMARLCGGDKINVAFTSPPYASQRKYDEASGFKPIPPDEYVAWWEPVQANVRQHLADDGSFFVNIKPHCEGGERVLYVFDLVLKMRRGWGWRFVDELIWKNAGVPGYWPNRFKDGFESIWHFAASDSFPFHPKRVGHQTADAFNGPGGMDGRGTGGRYIDVTETHEGIALPTNVIEVHHDVQKGALHPASFPIGLPSFFIRAFSDPGDVILDPFMGSGTTCISAENHGRRSLGCEISAKYAAVICQRCLDSGMQPRLLSPV